MKGPVPMIGRVVGAALGGAIGKQQNDSPLIGAAVGAVTMMAARRLLPARIAGLGAAVAAGYLTRKLAQRAERRAAAMSSAPAATAAPGGAATTVVPVTPVTVNTTKPHTVAARQPRAPRRPASR